MSEIEARIRIGDSLTNLIEGKSKFTLNPGVSPTDSPFRILNSPTTRLSGTDKETTIFNPDNGPEEITNLEEKLRVWEFNIKCSESENIDNLSAISLLKIHIVGKSSTAYQAYSKGSKKNVWFDIRLDNTLVWSSFIIIYGNVDDGNAYYTTSSSTNKKGLNIAIKLFCIPSAKSQKIFMRNDLLGSPGFISDTDSDGLADGWVALGTPVLSISDYGLVGEKSQSIIGSVFDGIESIKILCEKAVFGFIWVTLNSGQIVVRLYNDTDALGLTTYVVTAATIAANTDLSEVDDEGNIWYRFTFPYTLPSAKNLKLQVYADTGGANFNVDAAYLYSSVSAITTSNPSGWIGSSNLKNRYDPTIDIFNINYLDAWNISGDMPAAVNIFIEKTSVTDDRWIQVGKRNQGLLPNHDYPFWLDSTQGSGWTNTVDANASNGAYSRDTTGFNTWRYIFAAGIEKYFLDVPVRVFLLMRTSNLNNALNVHVRNHLSGDDFVIFENLGIVTEQTNQWALVDAGLINGKGTIPKSDLISNADVILTLDVTSQTVTGSIDLDAVLLIPTDDFFLAETEYTGDSILISEEYKSFYTFYDTYYVKRPHKGNMFYLDPKTETRLIFSLKGTTFPFSYNEKYTLNDEFRVSLEVTPISNHLIGDLE